MARRNNSEQPENPTPEAEVTEPTTAEAPAEAPKAEDKPVDLSGFQSAVNTALTEADTSTGEVPTANLDATNQAYRAIDGLKGKNAARAWLDETMKKAISEDKDITKARAIVSIKENLSAGSASSTPKAPADPTQAFVQKVAAVSIAVGLITENVPEGVAEDWAEKADELIGSLDEDVAKYGAWVANTAEDKGEAPEVSPVVRQAFKLASGRGSTGSTRVSGGPRRDIEKHLMQVFAEEEVGTFLTVNEIAKKATAEYGDERPSAGAVSARLFPKGKEPYSANGITAEATEGNPKGARKTA